MGILETVWRSLVNTIGWGPVALFLAVMVLAVIVRIHDDLSRPSKRKRNRNRRRRGRSNFDNKDSFSLPSQDRNLQPWERLSKRQVARILVEAQKNDKGEVTCAGCGVSMEAEFLELDHINPKSSNGPDNIENRILLCRPCNRIKGQSYTLPGLWQENTRRKRMRNLETAKEATSRAQMRAQQTRDEMS